MPAVNEFYVKWEIITIDCVSGWWLEKRERETKKERELQKVSVSTRVRKRERFREIKCE